MTAGTNPSAATGDRPDAARSTRTRIDYTSGTEALVLTLQIARLIQDCARFADVADDQGRTGLATAVRELADNQQRLLSQLTTALTD